MRAVAELLTLNASLPRVFIGVACTLLVLDRTRRRRKGVARVTSIKQADDGTFIGISDDDVDGVVYVEDPTPSAAAAAAATASLQPERRDALAYVAKLFTAVRVCAVIQSMWLALAVPVAIVKAWAESLPKLHMNADTPHAVFPTVHVNTVQSFCGTWVKDSKRSEPMDGFCDLFGVPRFLRQATRLMGGLELHITEDNLMVKQVCKLGFMSTTETYPLDGVHSSVQRRRDLRPGQQHGSIISAAGDQMQLKVVFLGRLPGEAVDTLLLESGGDTLVVHHRASVLGKGTAQFREVYIRMKP